MFVLQIEVSELSRSKRAQPTGFEVETLTALVLIWSDYIGPAMGHRTNVQAKVPEWNNLANHHCNLPLYI